MRCGAVVYATEQGLGRLAKDFFDHGVIDEVMIFRHPSGARETHQEWYPPGTPVLLGRPFGQRHHAVSRAFLERIDVLLCFETPFDWEFANYARSMNVKTALMTMYEWFPESPRHRFDLYLCPSLLDLELFLFRYPPSLEDFKKNTVAWVKFIPVPAPECTWTRRTTARRFLHNAGHVGSRNHKGTDTLLAAMKYVESPLELTVRCQDSVALDRLIRDYGKPPGDDPRVYYEAGGVPYAELFDPAHDVYVAPEKYNGLSLPLQEAFAHGMPVVTTDRYPANTWLPRELMVTPVRYDRVRVAPGHLEIDEAVVEPRDLARVLDGAYGQDMSRFSDAGRAWAEENSWAALGPKYRAALEGLL